MGNALRKIKIMLIPFNTICKKYDLKIRGILHLGAHLLEEKPDYDTYNVSKVVWIEGNPKIVQQAKEKADGKVHIVYNYLISDTDDEEVEFNIANNGQSSSILKLGKHSMYHPDVIYTDSIKAKTKTLKTIIKDNSLNINDYNFLNIDLQGVELKALRGLDKYLYYIDYIYTEVNSGNVYEGNDLITDIDEYLKEFGFERVETQFTGAEWGDAFYIKKAKRTQIVTHVMPLEIDEYSSIIDNLILSSGYLEKKDWISVYATLNLSPQLIDWNNSELNKQFFIDKFNLIKEKCNWANEVIFNIIEDDSILGTTSQKREAIKGNYDQFIFLDCDIAFHPTTLKYMLGTSYQIEGKYFITPQTVKLWDSTWDVLVHNDYKNQNYGYEKNHSPKLTYNQNITNIEVSISPNFKFGCGWFTLYSKDILDFIGIPEWLGHYGPEDTFLMLASEIAKQKYNITQYILNGIYVSENYIDRHDFYKDKIKINNLKQIFRQQSEIQLQNELNNFIGK
jgi:FkbM family methyltransferase